MFLELTPDEYERFDEILRSMWHHVGNIDNGLYKDVPKARDDAIEEVRRMLELFSERFEG